MNRYSTNQPEDNDAEADLGDAEFIGIRQRGDPVTLAPGYLADGRNIRLEQRRPEARRGLQHIRARAGAAFPLVFPIDFEQWVPFDGVRDVQRFRGLDRVEWVVFVTPGIIYAWRPGQTALQMTLPAGVVIGDEAVYLVPTTISMILLREGETTLECTDVVAGWTEITDANSGADSAEGTTTMPPGKFGVWHLNRLFLIDADDNVVISDALFPHRYAPLNRISVRSPAGRVNGIYPFTKSTNETTLVVSFDRGLYYIANLTPDSDGNFTSAQAIVITLDFGFVAPRGVVQKGADLFGLSNNGIVSLRQTETNELQGVSIPLSEPIQPTIGRINTNHARGSVLAALGNRLYCGVPLDAGEVLREELLYSVTYDEAGEAEINCLLPDRTYRYRFGANDTSLVNGTETYAKEDFAEVDFVAQSETITLNGEADEACTASLKPVFKGVNNAILVYNFANAAWESVDSGDGILPVSLRVINHYNTERLLVSGADGSAAIYEEAEGEDEIVVETFRPWVEVSVSSCPRPGDTLTVNGATITARYSPVNLRDVQEWGARNLAEALDNFQTGFLGEVFTVSDCTVVLAAQGVRFVSTSGTAPVVTATGEWPVLAARSGHGLVRRPFAQRIDSRGYAPDTNSRFLHLRAQLGTWNPDYTITALVPGRSAVVCRSHQRRDRRTSFFARRPDLDPTDADADFTAAGRQDYSVVQTETGNYAALNGAVLDQLAYEEVGLRVNTFGRYCQIRVENALGRLEVAGVSIAASEGVRRLGGVV